MFDRRFNGLPNMLTAQMPLVPQNMLSPMAPQMPPIDPTTTAAIPQPQPPAPVPQGDLNYFPPRPDANAAPITAQDYQASLSHLQPQNSPQQPAQQASGGSGGLDMGTVAAFLQGLGRGNGVLSAIGGGLGAVQEQKHENQTYNALLKRGVPEAEAQIVSRNPRAAIQVLQNLQKGTDPKTALELQGMQLDNQIKANKLENGPELPSQVHALQWQAQAAGLTPGSPEYQEFMLNGGGAPATFRALDMQAKAAGFEPGTSEYHEFMATRGAGLSAGAAQEAKNQADISSGGAAAGAKEGGKKTMEAGFNAWEDYGKLQNNIANIDEALGALDRGAASGYVYNMLPNITEASASLKNAMDRMGLDVIGSVTFGALSEGEMRLAMETAVPRGLQPTELRTWLERKRNAQIKAADMLADAARFLTVPGNTINGWIERNNKAKSGSSGNSGETVDFTDYFTH